ncbi:MAG TPA: MBL fold metallo-hydrolase [Gemmatimonadaceae bacterium]|nr:MBL fold metallo-hydrolase [Gemmatimonadaceae bacterium]
MQIEFSGAAREVTGSCHIVRVNGHTILLDCGLFQGRRKESAERNKKLPLPTAEIDAVVLSHAHIDHSGRLPFLVNEGYKGKIHCTAATRDLAAIMLADSAHIQEKDAEFLSRRNKEVVEPLYSMADAAATADQMIGYPYDQWFDVLPGVRALFAEAGHILGSASVVLEVTEEGKTKRLVFSGDIGRAGLPIIRDPAPPKFGADLVIMESTYGNRDHPPYEDARAKLAEIVSSTAAGGGRVLIPAFAVGRVQELVYDLHALAREGRIPAIPIYIDSPLAVDATAIFAAHPEVFDRKEELVREVQRLFHHELVRYTQDVNESKALNTARGPMIIISASGMAESGRILHHLANGAGEPRNTILVVGFMAEHTLGRRIVEKRPYIKVFGDEIPLRARVAILNGYSAHGDRTDLHGWLDAVAGASPTRPPVYLVHGEPEAQAEFRSRLEGAGYTVSVPAPGEKVEV